MAARVWLPVEDEVAICVARKVSEFDGFVELERECKDLPKDAARKVQMSEAEANALTPVSGDTDVAVEDLVKMSDVNTGSILNNLRLRYLNDDIFTSIGVFGAVRPEGMGTLRRVERTGSKAGAPSQRVVISACAVAER